MSQPIYQVDAFSSRLFGGNPAAVCPLEAWLPDEVMQAIAQENNLSETAFFVRNEDSEEGEYRIRWFTPVAEVELCGHATLASAWVVFNRIDPDSRSVTFGSHSGILRVEREGERLELDFPTRPAEPARAPEHLLAGLRRTPKEVLQAPYWLAIFETEAEVRKLRPDFAELRALDCPVIVSAPGESPDVDFVSRFFAPCYDIDEDPVTGSAHCTLTPYWAERLDKPTLVARQVSRRGGELICSHEGERTKIAGEAVLYLEGTILLPGD